MRNETGLVLEYSRKWYSHWNVIDIITNKQSGAFA